MTDVPFHYVEATTLEALRSRWEHFHTIAKRIRRRYQATDEQIFRALDLLEERQVAEVRNGTRKDPLGADVACYLYRLSP